MRNIPVYKIDEHPNKAKIFDWIRNNWHDLNDHSLDEIDDSISKLREVIGGEFSFHFEAREGGHQFLKFYSYDEESLANLKEYKLPLTGFVWDHILIAGLKKGKPERVIEQLHISTRYVYSDKGLEDLCLSMEYEFFVNGEFCAF